MHKFDQKYYKILNPNLRLIKDMGLCLDVFETKQHKKETEIWSLTVFFAIYNQDEQTENITERRACFRSLLQNTRCSILRTL